CCQISSAFSSQASHNFKIVTSFSLLQNWVTVLTQNIPADIAVISTQSLVPLQNDPHVHQITPMDAKAMEKADLIITIGLSFECWMNNSAATHSPHTTLFQAAAGVDARLIPAPDPHIWHDVQKVRQMVTNIAKVLCEKLPKAAQIINNNARVYDAELVKLDAWVRDEIAKTPLEQRKIITTHDAFYYYGKAYGVTFHAPVGLSTEAEADSKTVALLINQIKNENIKAIFFENLANRNIIRQIANETGIRIQEGDLLYADSLSEESGVAYDYIAMMKHNTTLIVRALMRG
ncbi:MAG: zinc ABC transporter substrate-binding protein, partial [Pseudomonadota bacterium]|nr:zinc ABC transporter substrate-binding protein [Pseudomonadota bacterium]